MTCCQITGKLLFIVWLLMTSCDKKQIEPGTDAIPDRETERIEGELRLMNLSQEAKTHTLTFGNENAFMKTEDVAAQATQIHERTFYLCSAFGKPRVLLVGKIRVEVCDKKPSKTLNDMSQNPDSNPK